MNILLSCTWRFTNKKKLLLNKWTTQRVNLNDISVVSYALLFQRLLIKLMKFYVESEWN